ncbi:MAG TPA: hypothetical protein VNZ26_12440, partial [Vicinamibacterales bacterium]|nr:hypothetical protein [Vicinamibacterales bacterium]
PDDRVTIEQLMERINELEHQVQALESAGTPTAPSDSPASSPRGSSTPAQAQPESHDMPSPAGLGALQIRGFNDIDYIAGQDNGAPNTFKIGQLDLFLSSKLPNDFSMVGEVVIEAGSDNAIGVDLERLLLQYAPSDWFNIAAGRYHTSIGYYNVTYHHGNWFQTATGRPFIFRFEDGGGILPVHNVGVTAQGQIPSGDLGLRYVAEIGNGRRSRSPTDEPVQNAADENAHKAFNLALLTRPLKLPGFQAGVSVYRDHLTPEGQAAIGETILAFHAIYQSPIFEQLNEAIFIRHAPDGSPAATTTSAYTQISRQFDRYRPYFRFEYLNIPPEDPDAVFHADAGRSYGPSIGLRFDAAPPVAIKAEYTRFRGPISNQTTGLIIQLAFTF